MAEPLTTVPNQPLPPLLRRGPQFGMRALFVFITVCCVLAALAGIVGQLWTLAAAWMIVITAAHVAGNVWGTRLRHPHVLGPLDGPPEEPWRTPRPAIIPCAPATRLRERTALGWTRVVASTLLALVGGLLGASLLWIVAWGRIDWGSLLIAGVSAAILGGFLGFLAASFLEVAWRAWREALQGYQLSTASHRPDDAVGLEYSLQAEQAG